MVKRTRVVQRTLTFEEHQAFARALKVMSRQISTMLVRTSNTKSKSAHRKNALKNLSKVNHLIGMIRSEMEELGFKDFPEKFSIHIYYGNTTDDGGTGEMDTTWVPEDTPYRYIEEDGRRLEPGETISWDKRQIR